MNPRIVIALAVVAVSALGAIVLAAPEGEGPSGPQRFEGAVLPAGLRAPDFTLTDQDGDRISMRSLRGTPVIVTFLYTTCED
ncbi:MAG: SCO family protein, partial [Solirubrobacterales bacterium]